MSVPLLLEDTELPVFEKAAKLSMGKEQPPTKAVKNRPIDDGNYKKYFASHIKFDMS